MNHQAIEPSENIESLSIVEVRGRLEAIREAEKAHYERAKTERDRLVVIEEPRSFYEVRYQREQEVCAEAHLETKFTDEEVKRLKFYENELKSWNPLARVEARRAKTALLTAHEQREGDAIRKALQDFHQEELPRMQEAHEKAERQYEAYEVMAYLWEDEMSGGRRVVDQDVPAIEGRLDVIERAGITTIEGIGDDAELVAIENAVFRCYRSVSEATRQSIEMRRSRELTSELQVERESMGME